MKNFILIAVMIASPILAQAGYKANSIACFRGNTLVKRIDVSKDLCLAPSFKRSGFIDTVACVTNNNQTLVARQKNGYSSLIEVTILPPVRPEQSFDSVETSTDNVLCRFE